jgi:dimethylglycine dehydrogenase
MTLFGMRAMMSLRLDRFFGSWLSEFSPDYTAAETGLDRFISFRKNMDFIGRSAAEAERLTPPERQLVIFEVDARDADAVAYEPVFINGTVQGFCTSGGYSHHAEKSIAFALVPRVEVTDDLQAEIEILGQLRHAKRLLEPLL